MSGPLRRASTLALCLLLGGCANSAARPPTPVARRPPAIRATPPPQDPPATTATAEPAAASTGNEDLWQQLRESFALDDCGEDSPDDAAAIAHWAHRFTENPARFQRNLRRALPSLRYIQQIARQRGIPGEFVLLPWVESHYLPVFGRHSRPVGLWQITRSTAKSIGLPVSHRYDGRLDTAATSEAIFDLLASYHSQYQDWRVTDYAFNSGNGAISRLLASHGAPPPQPAIPRLPVHRGTREHLIKLMAIACVIRYPAAHGVSLPKLPPAARLEPVVIPKAMPVAVAAAKAGLPEATLTRLNSAFLDGNIDPNQSETLLLPRANVQQWYANHPTIPPSSASVLAAPAAPAVTATPAPQHRHPHPHRYTVRPGDTIWSIARRHHLSTRQLIRWNRLPARPLQPGQVLRLGPG